MKNNMYNIVMEGEIFGNYLLNFIVSCIAPTVLE